VDITEDTIGIWYIESETCNWLCAIYQEGKLVKGSYRFRYYRDDKAFGSKDKKTWADICTETNKEVALRDIRDVAQKLCSTMDGELTELIRGEESLEDFQAELFKQDFAQVCIVPR